MTSFGATWSVNIVLKGSTLAACVTEALSGHDFTTAIGPVRFDAKGDLSQSPYRVFRFDGTRFVPLESN